VAVQNGTVLAWGCNYFGQTYVPPGLSGVKAVAAGAGHILALKNDGTVVGWGNNNSGQTSIPANLSGVIAIATGMDHSVALKTDGTVVAWGDNYYGQTTVPNGLSRVIAIDAAGGTTAALMENGTAVVWGNQNIVLYNVSAISADGAHIVALKNDGTVVAWGDNSSGQTNIPTDLGTSNLNGSVTYDPATLTLSFVPSSPLVSGASYNATVSGVRSQSGVPLVAPVSWNFTALDTMLPLNLGFAGTGAGRVDISSGGSCTGSCSNSYPQGTVVNLTATPSTNNIFGRWFGCDWVGDNQCTVTISGLKNVTASFWATGAPVTLTVDKVGSGSGSVISNPVGINLSSSWYGTSQFAAGTSVTLTAASESGSFFSGWRGACTGLGKCTIPLDSDSWATAVFTSVSTGNPGPVKINNQFFPLFQDAYNATLDGSSTTMFANSLNLFENLVFDRNIVVTLKGGYDNSFGSNTGLTVLRGTLTITNGSVIMDNIVIQ
jgi:hypothetical protein